MCPSGHFPAPVKTPPSPASSWGTPREAFAMGKQHHLVGRLVPGTEALLSLCCLFTTLDTLLFKTTKKEASEASSF